MTHFRCSAIRSPSSSSSATSDEVHLISLEHAKGLFITARTFPCIRLHSRFSLTPLSPVPESCCHVQLLQSTFLFFARFLNLQFLTWFMSSFWSALSRNVRAITPTRSYLGETHSKPSSPCFAFPAQNIGTINGDESNHISDSLCSKIK